MNNLFKQLKYTFRNNQIFLAVPEYAIYRPGFTCLGRRLLPARLPKLIGLQIKREVDWISEVVARYIR